MKKSTNRDKLGLSGDPFREGQGFGFRRERWGMTISDRVALAAFAEGRSAVDAQELMHAWTGCMASEISRKMAGLMQRGLLEPSTRGVVLSVRGYECMCCLEKRGVGSCPEIA